MGTSGLTNSIRAFSCSAFSYSHAEKFPDHSPLCSRSALVSACHRSSDVESYHRLRGLSVSHPAR
jgi:hypothetical protein